MKCKWFQTGNAVLALILIVSITACASAPNESTASEPVIVSTTQETEEQTSGADSVYMAGTYTATAAGLNGDVTVEATFTENGIEKVEVVEHQETGPGVSAIDALPGKIIESQTVALDTIAGATYTSKAILEAVADCIMQAGGDVNALQETPEKSDEEKAPEMLEADVIVVGGGLSGLNAAVFAAEAGASVILIEKLGFVGGSGMLSSGGMFTAESNGLNDTRDDSLEEALAFWSLQTPYGGESGYPDMDRLSYTMEKTGATVQALHEMGLEIGAVYNFNIMSEGGGAGLTESLKTMAEERGVTIYVDCKGEELIVEGEKVVGVKATGSDGPMELRGSSVILAAGGFAASEELVEQWAPECAVMHNWRLCKGDVGEGILMALDVGAVLYENPWLTASGTFVAEEYGRVTEANNVLALGSSLAVNDEGNRFTNEAPDSFSMITSIMTEQQMDHCWALMNAGDNTRDVLEQGIEMGEVFKGSIEELAQQLNMDQEVLQATVDTYNAACETGKDDEFGKAEANLIALSTDELYAVKYYPTCIGSMGGVKVNHDCQVLREDGSIIEGLFAVGEMSNRSFYNYYYVGGGSVGLYSTTGRIAGELAAELAKK